MSQNPFEEIFSSPESQTVNKMHVIEKLLTLDGYLGKTRIRRVLETALCQTAAVYLTRGSKKGDFTEKREDMEKEAEVGDIFGAFITFVLKDAISEGGGSRLEVVEALKNTADEEARRGNMLSGIFG